MVKALNSNLLVLLLLASFLFTNNNVIAQKKEKVNKSQKAIKWLSLQEAEKLTKKKPKKIFIDVYTHWCGWCKRMDATTFKNPEIVKYINKKFYAVKLNAETRDTINFKGKEYTYQGKYRANGIAIEMLKGRMAYPSFVILDEKADILQPIPGFKSTKDLQPILEYYGNNHHKKTEWKIFKDNYNANKK